MAASLATIGKSDEVQNQDSSQVASKNVINGFYCGWVRDFPEIGRRSYVAPASVMRSLPNPVNLRDQMPKVYDQKKILCCTPCALATMVQFVRKKHGQNPDFPPSRLFLYFNARRMAGDRPRFDTGVTAGDAMRALEKFGVCSEEKWPYDGRPVDPATGAFPRGNLAAKQPSDNIYADALPHRALLSIAIDHDLQKLKASLADGYPFMFGFTMYESFFASKDKPLVRIPLPQPHEESKGRHYVLAVGYNDNDDKGHFLCRNSWGETHQEGGYFYMPYAYFTSRLTEDFWTLRTVQSIDFAIY